jgi:hypothetical protein
LLGWLGALKPDQWTAIAAIAAAVATFFALISSVIAAISAFIQAKSAKISQNAHEADVAHAFFAEYGSEQMLKDMICLSQFRKDNPNDFVEKFIEGRFTDPFMMELDNARRRVKTHYLKAVGLHRRGLISDVLFFTIIDSRGILLLHKVVIPMTIKTDNPTNPEINDYKYLENYHPQLRWCTEYKDDDV